MKHDEAVITIRGARTHNLKNINLILPRNRLIVITGLSGSGKSSLAFDTLYAEGQRRYVESLSAYARQFLDMMEKPDVDLIEGLSPAIAIAQKTTSHNPRSTVGTVTEIYDYLRLLFARVGIPYCPEHHLALQAKSISQMVDELLASQQAGRMFLLAPLVCAQKGEAKKLFNQLAKRGFVRVRVDGIIYELPEVPELTAKQKHTIEVVVDRFKADHLTTDRLSSSLETALELADGIVKIIWENGSKISEQVFSAKFACPECGYALTELEPRLFSFNNPLGACSVCGGLGFCESFDPQKIITNETLTISEGAICGWNRRNPYYFGILSSVAKHYSFSLDIPYQKLSDDVKKLLLYGKNDELVDFVYQFNDGSKIEQRRHFEGVIPFLERRYHDSDSDAVKHSLSKYLSSNLCTICHGSRLKLAANHVLIGGKSIAEVTKLSIIDALNFFSQLILLGKQQAIAKPILKEIKNRLRFLIQVGLEYLSLDRSAETLSGGEAQRIRLASQFGSGLLGVLYILDEPTIGLHERDNQRLLAALLALRDLGNTVIVVEHDEEIIRAADYIVDIGPGAGVHGGEVIFSGKIKELLCKRDSLTSKFLTGELRIKSDYPQKVIDPAKQLVLDGVNYHNLHDVKVAIPVGLLTCVTGVSGSGKSSLINDIVYSVVTAKLNHTTTEMCRYVKDIYGLEFFDRVIAIDQSAIGKTPRSNPATYVGMFSEIRNLFALTQPARARGYNAGRFSFNVPGGRCEACHGEGQIKVEMHFLADIYVNCDLCHGGRYNRETLEITYKGKNIAEVLAMTVEEALQFFEAIPILKRKLQTLIDVGLPYITLGQSATTFSGGEAQRIKLARELSKVDTGNTLYILDEPTTGLHFYDVNQLLQVLMRLRERGNTILVIEHNLDIIRNADWLIDLGPEGGDSGGKVIAIGSPLDVAQNPISFTGQFLRKYFSDFAANKNKK